MRGTVSFFFCLEEGRVPERRAIQRTYRLSIRFKPQQAARLKALAETRGESIAELVRAAVSATLFNDTLASVDLPAPNQRAEVVRA
jgi:hypothetical protein